MSKEERDEFREIIRINLKNLREKKGITQKDLGIEIDKSPTAIASWEQGLSLPDIYTLFRLANYYNVTMEYFYKNHESEEIDTTKVDEKTMKDIEQRLLAYAELNEEYTKKLLDISKQRLNNNQTVPEYNPADIHVTVIKTPDNKDNKTKQGGIAAYDS